MSAPKSPPPGSVPSLLPSPDVSSMMKQFGQSGGGSDDLGSATAGDPSALQNLMGNSGQAGQPSQPIGGDNTSASSPRAMGTPAQELKYAAGDISQGLLSHFPKILRDAFHIGPQDSAAIAARKQQMMQHYQSMTAEEQAYVQKQAQEKMVKQRREEEEKQRVEMQKKQAAASEVVAPAGKVSGAGAGAPGMSKKKATSNYLSQQRQQLSSAG